MQLNGFILIGGKSTRMGMDKSSITYKNQTHRVYLADLLLETGCESVYFSCTEKQASKTSFEYPIIVDKYLEVGPIGGVLSAFYSQPNCAWLVLGCDYPLLGKESIQQLMEQRDETTDVTLFKHPESQLLEPLLTIYEPSAFSKIKVAFQDGQRSLRKILASLNTNCLAPNTPHQLMNSNTPLEKEQALQYIKTHL